MAAHDTIARTGSAPLSLTPAGPRAGAAWPCWSRSSSMVRCRHCAASRTTGAPARRPISATYLADPSRLRLAVLFFFLSTLIFVFGIPFVAGLRLALRAHGSSDLFSSVLAIGAGLFFAGGLVSEVMSTGMATVVLAAPSYVPDANAALAVQALQFAALLQGQVGLGVAILAVSVAMWHVPGWRAVAIIGLVAGAIDLARPLAVAMPVLAIALFIPTFVWIALASLRLIRADD